MFAFVVVITSINLQKVDLTIYSFKTLLEDKLLLNIIS